MWWMAPATTKSQAILQHAGGIATSSGWGHRPGHALCALERYRPQTERRFLPWSLQLQVWGMRMMCHDQGQSLAKQSLHTVASDTRITWLSYHISLGPLPGFAGSCSGLLAYLGKYNGFGGLGPPACLMCFHSLVSALAEEQAIFTYFIPTEISSS